MRSDNENKTTKLNRMLAQRRVMLPIVAGFDLLLLLGFNYIVGVLGHLMDMTRDAAHVGNYLGPANFLPHFAGHGILYLFFFLVIAGLDGMFIYQVHFSYSDKELNHGQKGTARWATRTEIAAQYKPIPLKDAFYQGRGGTIISRQGNTLYVDDSNSNTLVIGTTRSGKGEMYVFPSIDVYSRAKLLSDRPSMIVSDPKMELYKSCKKTLEDRGYEVRLLNLANPLRSMGYNPLQLVVDYFRQGFVEQAQMAAKTFSFSIFAADNSTQEPIWKNTATDLFTALIIAIATDCMQEDEQLNEERRRKWAEKRERFAALRKEEQEIARRAYEDLAENEEDAWMDESCYYLPPEVDFYEIHPNEKKVSCFSCLNFFRDLCDRKALANAGSEGEREKIAQTALDEYFNNRPPLDYAKSLYQEIKTAGERTKGSVYLNMQSAVSVFALDNIARMTACNDVNIEEIGYGEKPVAIFIGIPLQDRSNHFLVTTFIAQIYQRLFQLTQVREGKKRGELDRKVKFILDEFGNFPEIENFAGFVTVCLGLGISFDIYVQALNQISAIYKDDAKTILENFANQIYIKSVGKDSAEEFSEALGHRTVVEVQRSGGRGSLDKNFTETIADVPLMYPDQMNRLKEGECVVYRGIKRTDRLGAAIESHPIINEFADPPKGLDRVRIIKEMEEARRSGHSMRHPNEDRCMSREEELHVREDAWMREHGTVLLYRYQYLQGTFPNPGEIDLETVNTESRADVDYTNLVYDPQEVLRKLSGGGHKFALRICDHAKAGKILALMAESGAAIGEKNTIAQCTEAACALPQIKEQVLDLINGKEELSCQTMH